MLVAEVAEEDNVNNIYMKRTRKKKARKFVKRRKKTRGRSLFGGKHLNKYFIPILVPFLLTWVFGFLRITIDFILITMCAGRLMAKEQKK